MDDHDDEGAVFPLTVTIAGWLWIMQGVGWFAIALWGLSILVGARGDVCVMVMSLAVGAAGCSCSTLARPQYKERPVMSSGRDVRLPYLG